MKRLFPITILLIASLSPLLLAQDCNNPLLNFFGIQGLELPESGVDLLYCQSLKTSETCCSAETVSDFYDRANVLVDKLNNYGAARDLYLARFSGEYFDRFRDILQDVNELHDKEIAGVRRNDETLAAMIENEIKTFNQVVDRAQQLHDRFETALKDYQTARKKCFDTAVVIQTSAWCLACSPNYATQGVNADGSVNFSKNLCRNITEACWPYFEQGARFNAFIRMREVFNRLLGVWKYLHDFPDNNEVVFRLPNDDFRPISTQTIVIVPRKWTDRDGMCQDLWSNDLLLSELLGIGYAALNLSEEEGTLIEEEQGMAVDMGDGLSRLLVGLFHTFAYYDWDPNGLEPGFGIEPDSDPANYYYYQDISDWLGFD